MSPGVSDVDQIAAEMDAAPRAYARWAPSDMLRLVVGLVIMVFGLFLAAVAQNTVGGAEEDIVSWFNRLPDRTVGVVIGLGQVLVTVVPLAVYALLLWRRQFRLFGMLFLGANVAGWLTTLIESRYADRLGVVEDTHDITRGWVADSGFPSSSVIAGAAAFVTITAPWLSARWRRATWATLIVLVLLRILGSGEPPLDIVVAIAIGLVIGSLTLMVFGSPSAAPRVVALVEALRRSGIEPTGISRLDEDDRRHVFVVDNAGAPAQVIVKVRTPEDRSSDLLNRFWAAARLRTSEVERPYSNLRRRVEHEAFAMTVARDRGAEVPEMLALGETERGSVLLASRFVEGTTIADSDAPELSDTALDSLWSQIAALRSRHLAHRKLDLTNLIVDADEQVWLVDFDRADVAASDRDLDRDIAELLVSLSAKFGVEPTVRTAIEMLGPEAVGATLPQLQPLALPPEVRKAAKAHKGLLDEISASVRDLTGAPQVELEKIERIKPRTVLMVVAGSLAFYALLPQFANVDETVSAFQDANLWWVPAILFASFATYVFATISALGAYSLSLPVMATFRSQLASSFTALVAPANAGGMALGVRFLQRAGFETTAASTAVGLNAIAGIVAHVVLLFAFISWAGQTGVGDFHLPDASTALIVITVVLVLAGLLLLIAPVRRRVLAPAIRILRTAGDHLGSVFKSPARLVALLGGSAFVTLAYAATLVFCVEALGGGLTIPQIGAAYMVASTLATIAPTPGGLGALEAAMITSLSGFGMDHGPAVSAVLTFRLATFWLPILPGWIAFTWMERNDEL